MSILWIEGRRNGEKEREENREEERKEEETIQDEYELFSRAQITRVIFNRAFMMLLMVIY